MAENAEPFRSLFDVDDGRFLPPGDMPSRIQTFCRETNQPVPETHGQIVRAIYESLALKYRYVLDKLIAASGQTVERVHIIGGGSQNEMLTQMTANATGRLAIAGPVEATALGNAMVQFIAAGELANLSEAREMLSQSADTVTYEPENASEWDAQVERYAELITSD
jgi:sugar (pentulose or hexulose) kinase